MAFQSSQVSGESPLGMPTGLVTKGFPDYDLRFQVRPEQRADTMTSPFAGLNSLQIHPESRAMAAPLPMKATVAPTGSSAVQEFLPSVAGPLALNVMAATSAVAGLAFYLGIGTTIDAIAVGIVALVAIIGSQVFWIEVLNQTFTSGYNLFLSVCAVGALAYLVYGLVRATR